MEEIFNEISKTLPLINKNVLNNALTFIEERIKHKNIFGVTEEKFREFKSKLHKSKGKNNDYQFSFNKDENLVIICINNVCLIIKVINKKYRYNITTKNKLEDAIELINNSDREYHDYFFNLR